MRRNRGATTSFWMDTAKLAYGPALTESTRADVCVVGAGITGLTTAYLLARDACSVVVIDDGPIGGGETGRTTGHLSSVIDDRFQSIEKHHGLESLRLAYHSHAAAIDRIEEIVATESIDCGFERLDGYLFRGPKQDTVFLRDELDAAVRAGFDGVVEVGRAPIESFDTGLCLRFPRQAQFHSLRYLAGLARALGRMQVRIHSRTRAKEIQGGVDARVKTESGLEIRAGAVVVATNSPVNNRVALQTKLASYRTYVIGARIPRGAVPRALYWDTASPYHYVRVADAEDGSGDEMLIVGGEDHKTGQEVNPSACHRALESWTRTRFPIGGVEHRWSGQVVETVDGLAFIGRNPLDERNVYIATGDSGMGLTHGTIAGMLISDLVLEKPNVWAGLYDPARKSIATAGKYLGENLNTAVQYIRDFASPGDVSSEDEIPPGCGAVLRRGLSKVAVYRDEADVVYELSAVCPHLGGIVHWNDLEKSWDCPCHGSRFDRFGNVINGPAIGSLGVYEKTRRAS
jgi:glycine/D-amino acid oxidase-like deaminating enzyme